MPTHQCRRNAETTNRPDNFKLGFEKAAQTLKHNPVIIGKKDSGFFHARISY